MAVRTATLYASILIESGTRLYTHPFALFSETGLNDSVAAKDLLKRFAFDAGL